jgi:hypothetical protein
MWKLYREIVHNTLFFEVIYHLAQTTVDVVQKHGYALAFLLALLVSVIKSRKKLPAPPPQPPKKRAPRRKPKQNGTKKSDSPSSGGTKEQ